MVEKRRAELGTVRDWMTRQPVTAPPDATVAQVAGLMRANRIRHVLVVDDERVVGVVSERDVRGLVLEGEPTMSPTSPVREVMNDLPVTVTPETPLRNAKARQYLEALRGRLKRRGSRARILLRPGDPGREIPACAAAERVQLIATSTHGRSGLRRTLFGSVAEAVLRRASVPVLLVRGTAARARR